MLSNLIIDLMILAAPMPIIWRMQMTVALKIQVTGIFALGFLYVSSLSSHPNMLTLRRSVAAGTVSAYITLLATYGPETVGSRDLQGINTNISAWILVEIAAALIACCLPTLRPLFANTSLGALLGSLFSAVSSHSRQSRHSRQGKYDGALAAVSIGGSEMKNPRVEAKEKGSEASSLQLSDVGSLA